MALCSTLLPVQGELLFANFARSAGSLPQSSTVVLGQTACHSESAPRAHPPNAPVLLPRSKFLRMHTLDEALALQSPADYVARGISKEYAAIQAIWERINSRMVGRAFDEGLTRGERLVHVLFFAMDGEIENGGMHQFFSNSSGDLAEDAKAYLRQIGATRVLAVLTKASSIFPKGKAPTDRNTRNDILTEREGKRGDAFWDEFDRFSREYYKARQELYPRLLAWIRRHRDEFALPDDETVRKANRKRPRKKTRRQRKPSSDNGPSPKEFEALKKGLEQLATMFRMISVRRVGSPTQAHVRVLRKFEPFRTHNLVEIRKALSEGSVRLGPLAEHAAADAVTRLLAPAGLQCRLVPVAPDELGW